MQLKRDYYLVTLIGFLVGWLILLPAANSGLAITASLVAASVIGFTLLAPIALWFFTFLSRFWAVLAQFGKFAAVGTLNTLLDLGILNLLISLTGLAAGWPFSGFKAISFLFATTNSYFWNKFWTFQSRLPITVGEYGRFIFFTFIGTIINVSVASVIVNIVGPQFGIEPRPWANIGAVIAVFAGMLWNFLSYKQIVFSSKFKS